MFDAAIYQEKLAAVEAAVTNNDKGHKFEELASCFITGLDGVEIYQCDARMDAEEVDIVVWNAQIDPVLRAWNEVFLVECKNWSQRIGAQALDAFIAKLRRRSLKTGMFVAARGVTGDFIDGSGQNVGATAIIAAALQEGIRVIVITLDDLRGIGSTDDIRGLVKQRYCGLFVHRIF